MSQTPDERIREVEIPADAPEADVLEQTTAWAPEEEQDLPAAVPDDAPEGDALDQARDVNLGDDDEEPA